MSKKRVRTLLRVSSKQQLHDDDIPIQRAEAADYIAKRPDWEFDKEYIENVLGMSPHDKEVALYEGKNVEEIYNLTDEYLDELDKVISLTEEELYFVYNIYKKRNHRKGRGI